MALNKTIITKRGVTVAYHRIALVNVQVNDQITILVESYIDQNARQKVKDFMSADHSKNVNSDSYVPPYTESEYISFKYDEQSDMFKGNVVQKAYNWLKKQEKFKGSKDILEVV